MKSQSRLCVTNKPKSKGSL
jgi:uncharacterized membrane protein YheB (UPF0754 family)